MAIEFLTLPDELQSLANDLLVDLTRRGYACEVEPSSLLLPATPTISAKRGHEIHHILVRQGLSQEEIGKWFGYACSCTADTRFSICCPEENSIPANQIASLRTKRIGLSIKIASGFQVASEARDLAFHARAPERETLKPKVRALLGEAFDRLDDGDWRPAFEDACTVLEEECRSYLLTNLRMGRVKYKAGKKIKTPTEKQIRKMTMGALRDAFCKMISQNQIEANLCTALTKLNPDRVRRAHKRRAAQVETALRRRVGPHFWMISNALSLIV